MAENADGQERSERPTSKRIKDAREKGQVPRSRELATLASLLVSALTLMLAGPAIIASLSASMRSGFTITRQDLAQVGQLPAALLAAIIDATVALMPLLLALALAAVVANVALAGWNFSAAALRFRPDKLNPVSGLKRVFGWRGLMEMLKGLAKFVIVAAVAWLLLSAWRGAFLGLGGEPLQQGLAHASDLLLWSFLILSGSLVLVVLVDVPFQLWDHQRQLKMTKQEVKEEFKQTEGNPEVKRRQRQIQFEAAQRRMMAEVPKADVVVTNPTHYAVALRYEQRSMDAPLVVAKGMNLIAAKIRTVAAEHQVPILEAPALARAIYFSADIDQPIPAGLYRAVAQVLAYVYHLRQGPVYDREGRQPELNVEELPIPDELRRDP